MARNYGTRTPSTPEQLLDTLMDPSAAAAAFGGTPAEWKQFNSDYAARAGASDPGIKEQVQIAVSNALRANPSKNIQRLNLDPNASNGGSRGSAIYNKKAIGAKYDGMFEDMGSLLQAGWHRGNPNESQQGNLSQLKNAFGSTVPSDGGFLIPEAMRSDLLSLALEKSIVRPRANVIPMSSLTLPIPYVDSTSNASSVHGGMVGAWTEEGAQLDDTSPSFGRVKLEAKKLTCYSEVPNELFADAPALQGFIEMAYPEALSWFEDVGFLTGTGVGEPEGFLNSPAAVSVTKESGQLADTILYENLAKMYSRMLPSSLNTSVWIANIDTFFELATIALSVGTGGNALWVQNAASPAPMSIFGRPLIFTEKVPTLGDAGDVTFVDLSKYLIGDRQSAELRTSEHFKFRNDQTSVRITSRVDGRSWIRSAVTPQTGTSTLSPVVKIAARA